jgi:deoxyribodipyrimidine photolyase-related protein
MTLPKAVRHLVLVLGDQLDQESAALREFDPVRDIAFMAEVTGESTHVWSSKPRTAFFLTAMRHFAASLRERSFAVDYQQLGTHSNASLGDALIAAIERHRPEQVVMVEAGEWRIEQEIAAACERKNTSLLIRDDEHFLITRVAFAQWAGSYKQLRQENFYRMMRRHHHVLMDGDEPLGGRWNFDDENRGAFGKAGPPLLPSRNGFDPDAITRAVFADIEQHFSGHPGSLADFAWPVTRQQALQTLATFINDCLPRFGAWQDAMWTDQPFLFHSLISPLLNVKLLNPREVIDAAVAALHAGHAPIEAVEGFVRQILGWREFIRGVYWLDMPGMRDANHYRHTRVLPAWYWTAETHMNCMKEAIGQTLQYGYAHHIQRLMVTGIWALLAEISPREIEDWYLAVYVDAVEWAELPNVAGMAIHANGGRFTSKPYIASGQYIKRMSNYCTGCRYKPEQKTGVHACPTTTLYWYFLDKHERELAKNPRTSLMAKNISKLADDEREAIRQQARHILDHLDQV